MVIASRFAAVFQRVKQVGAYTFHDEIDASSVTPAK